MTHARFAIYHLPDGALGDLGSAWLGWDARTGTVPDRPEIAGLPAAATSLTSIPMRYGFHATLKAPFRLAEGHSVEDLARRTELVCDRLAPFEMDLDMHCDWGFVMLRPRQQSPALTALEQALVTRLDDLRAPLLPEDRARRRPDQLPEKARAHLDNWGYPFVLDLFNYHLTLSNGLPAPEAQAVQDALAPVFAPLIEVPMQVRSVALVGEADDGRLQLIRDIPLRG
ncbi:DUF1045 domain-containing protein [Paracoccus aestuariivivens]|uniref:DUF1045 domain-containing protein n=1 Tax=Paracoccus aestuariivivens TaxID=1820333 RepID=A0A6L6J3T1_9RHOB|nr:DUF1045 domain-containing protein [Paracoccus aestuariivivens]MTH76206.1 DUF1045 domain-containing protein [Paracoccus aestuariivivens]